MRHCVLVLIAFSVTYAQAPPVAAPGRPQPDPAKIGKLLETGRCAEGLPHVRKLYVRAAPELKRKLGSSGVRCAMKLNQRSEAAALIEALNRDFPNDPDVLYLTVHTYSDLSLRASQALLFSHPDAYQVHQLNAESLEMQERWDDAAHEYRAVLEKNPQLDTSIRLRLPYIEPLNLLQVELLKRHRAGDTDPRVAEGIQLSINAVATGLRNSG